MTMSMPQVVMVTRETEYDALLARHATHDQARFFLTSRAQSIDSVKAEHDALGAVLQRVSAAIPTTWRRASVNRGALDRFLFTPEDIVLVVGQDGLVANVAKYLSGQPVIGVNPNPARYDGVLVRHDVASVPALLRATANGGAAYESRTMVLAKLDDGQELLGLNEVFIGVRSHQSARYTICANGAEERQSSSGMIVATGTGATGWARSIHRERGSNLVMPSPEADGLIFFVREAFPSVATGTSLTEGLLSHGGQLKIRSENKAGGVIFADGVERDWLAFEWGSTVEVSASVQKLRLVSNAVGRISSNRRGDLDRSNRFGVGRRKVVARTS